MISNISQWFPTRFPEAHQLCKFYVSLIRPMYFCSWSLYKQAELFRMCLIRKNLIMCSVGVPPETGLETGIRDNSVLFFFWFFFLLLLLLIFFIKRHIFQLHKTCSLKVTWFEPNKGSDVQLLHLLLKNNITQRDLLMCTNSPPCRTFFEFSHFHTKSKHSRISVIYFGFYVRFFPLNLHFCSAPL